MSKDSPISSGHEQLDRDVQFVLALQDDAVRLGEIAAAASDPSLTVEQFIEKIPHAVLNLVRAVLDESDFNKIMVAVPEAFRSRLTEARNVLLSRLPTLPKHPALREIEEALGDADDRQAAKHIINGIRWEPHWYGDPARQKLTPSAIVYCYGGNNRLLLQSYLDWDDLMFLARTFAKITSEQLAMSKTMLNALDFAMLDRIKQRALQLSEYTRAIDNHLTELSAVRESKGGKQASENIVDRAEV